MRLREKSLKDKTKAELHWLENMKKQSRDKGSDDVMPSIKKRERGIKMKLKAEKVGGWVMEGWKSYKVWRSSEIAHFNYNMLVRHFTIHG